MLSQNRHKISISSVIYLITFVLFVYIYIILKTLVDNSFHLFQEQNQLMLPLKSIIRAHSRHVFIMKICSFVTVKFYLSFQINFYCSKVCYVNLFLYYCWLHSKHHIFIIFFIISSFSIKVTNAAEKILLNINLLLISAFLRKQGFYGGESYFFNVNIIKPLLKP